MKVLLLIHGKLNSEISIENSFLEMSNDKVFSKLKTFYYTDFFLKYGEKQTLSKIYEIAKNYLPDLIILFHIGKFPIKDEFFINLKCIKSKPQIIYDEGDIYGGWAKKITNSMKIALKNADFVSIRGKGIWFDKIKKYNSNIIYTPHCASLYHLFNHNLILNKRKRKFIFIGNYVKSKLGNIRRLPGAKGREDFLKEISRTFPEDIEIYGNGWQKLKTNYGPINFKDQLIIDSANWFHISFEHYPKVSHYYSDRLPIALLCGQIYITHYHEGYEEIFSGCKFIFFYKTTQEAINIIKELKNKDENELSFLSKQAHEFALDKMLPTIVWKKTIEEIFLRIK